MLWNIVYQMTNGTHRVHYSRLYVLEQCVFSLQYIFLYDCWGSVPVFHTIFHTNKFDDVRIRCKFHYIKTFT